MTAIACLMLTAQALQLYEMTPEQVDGCLSELHAATPEFGARVTALARLSLGTPYAGGPLGEGPEGKYDTDPLVDLAHVDCVTFVEQTLALANEPDYEAAVDLLQHIRYEEGRVDFEARNHFMITDWIAHNGFCKDVTAELGVPTEAVTRTIRRHHYFTKYHEAPELGADTPDETRTLQYLPAAHVPGAVERMPSPALVLFIGKLDWLFVLHCGFFVRDGDKDLLIHASSSAKEVVAVDFTDYMADMADSRPGITVYALNPVSETGCP